MSASAMAFAPARRSDGPLRLAIVSPEGDAPSETFIRAHVARLPFDVVSIRGTDWDCADGKGAPLLWQWRLRGALARRLSSDGGRGAFSRALAARLRGLRVDAVMAEFGPNAVRVRRACELAGLPLFAHFHGYDAYSRNVLAEHEAEYAALFAQAAGVVAVSTPMLERLKALGAPADRLHLSPCGVDPEDFSGAEPGASPPHFVAVGRFVEKKAPYLTVHAFKTVADEMNDARLSMVGDGSLMGPTRRLAAALGLHDRVDFLGIQPPEVVSALMRSARAFVQHSVVADNGDCEGTPVAVIEAQMSGLPVVATAHAGIPEVVADGETGYIVPEGDTAAMGERMLRLARDPALAARLGVAGRRRALERFTMERHLSQLAGMIEDGVRRYRKT